MLRLALTLLLFASAATAQEVGTLLSRTLGPGAVALYWLPDAADAATMREAIRVAYLPIAGAAGNTTIAVAHYARTADGLALVARIEELYGLDPREPAFLPDRIELTTTMPRPDDPRCCPTGPARWSIDRKTHAATRLR